MVSQPKNRKKNASEIDEVSNALRESELRLRTLYDGIDDGVFVHDEAGKILDCNAATCRRLGYTREELLTMYTRDIDDPVFAQDFKKRLKQQKSDGNLSCEGVHITKAGRQINVEINSSVIEYQGNTVVLSVVRDITERKHAQEALQNSEALYSSLVENIPQFIFRKDLKGRFTFANQKFCAMLEKPREAIIGKTDFDLYPSELAKKFQQDDLEIIHNKALFETVEENRKPDGEIIYVHVIKTPLRNAMGDIVGVQGIFWDITGRKRAEEKLNKTMAELERSNKELEQFAYIASHDLQEPLRMVSSFTQLLAKRYKGQIDKDADEFIGFAVDGARRMQNLLNDLLTYSRVSSKAKPFKRTDCNEVLSQTLDNLRLAIEDADAEVTHDALPSLPADDMQLMQLFQNLIGNAIKFHADKKPAIHISAEKTDRSWLFSVADNGIGIAPENRDSIFQVFRRLHTKEEYPGTGIGLAICMKIVQRHGGEIHVDSEPGKGSTFSFTLPDKGAQTS